MLTSEEIAYFASRPDVRKIDVENFLMSIDPAMPHAAHLLNLARDGNAYKWNKPTVLAIMDVISLVYNRKVEVKQP